MKAQKTSRQVIITKYVGNSKYIVEAYAGRMTYSYDHAISDEENHAQACIAFCKKFEWTGDRVGGEMPDGSYAWVAVF